MITGNDCFATLGNVFSTPPYFFSHQIKKWDNYLSTELKSKISSEWFSLRWSK